MFCLNTGTCKQGERDLLEGLMLKYSREMAYENQA